MIWWTIPLSVFLSLNLSYFQEGTSLAIIQADGLIWHVLSQTCPSGQTEDMQHAYTWK